jgi:hypothetical protein
MASASRKPGGQSRNQQKSTYEFQEVALKVEKRMPWLLKKSGICAK